MAILSKGHKPYKFDSHNSLKPSFSNIRGLFLNFVKFEFFLESYSHDIRPLCGTDLDDWIDSDNSKIFCYSDEWSCSLFEWRTSFCTGLISRKHCIFVFMVSTVFTPFFVKLLFPLSITFFILFRVFDAFI